jgi:alanyl aminopeptidase
LSEGFATWLCERILDEDKPAVRRRLSAVVSRERVMRADESKRALAVRRTLKSREQMNSVYNRFVYQKGAAVLQMLEAWLGDVRFRDGLRAYLRKHHFGIATTADLASAIHGATGTDVSGVMSAFLDQTGVPSIRVRTTCETGRQPRLRIEQINARKRWTLPVCWVTEAAGRSCVIVGAEEKEVELESRTCPAWIFPNAGGAGYHRTDWQTQQLAALKLPELTAAERLTLVHDLGAMKRAGTLPEPGDQLLASLRGDTEPEIAEAAKNALESP